MKRGIEDTLKLPIKAAFKCPDCTHTIILCTFQECSPSWISASEYKPVSSSLPRLSGNDQII